VAEASSERVRVLRVITRMNLGGPPHQVALLSGRLDRGRYETLLVHGTVAAGEASMADLAEAEGAKTRFLASLGQPVRPLRDLRALAALIRIVRRFRPHIVHTHTAKAGFLGRAAAVLAGGRRRVVIHTYHGHVLEGYFGRLKGGVYRVLERLLGRGSDCLIGVSQATVDDLVRLSIAPRSKFRVIPLGLDLERFERIDAGAAADLRRELHIGEEEVLFTYVGRVVPIKRLDVMIRGLARAAESGAAARLGIVGDGEIRPELEALCAELGVESLVQFLGYRHDLPRIAAATDVAVLSSDNEGTPVWLIEAAAAGSPAIATAVGGVPEVVTRELGLLVPAGDDGAFARAMVELAGETGRRVRMGESARKVALARYSIDRLLGDIDALYRELVRKAAPPTATGPAQGAGLQRSSRGGRAR
jgi:glycosyltransferase involved in cell wall biosynthesis